MNAEAQGEGGGPGLWEQPAPRAEVGLGPGRQCGRSGPRCFPKRPLQPEWLFAGLGPRVPTLTSPRCHPYPLAPEGPNPRPRTWGLVSITLTASLFCFPQNLATWQPESRSFLLPVPFTPAPATARLPPAPSLQAWTHRESPRPCVFSCVVSFVSMFLFLSHPLTRQALRRRAVFYAHLSPFTPVLRG